MPEHIDDFIQVQKPPETMSFLELRAYVIRLQESGHQVGKYLVQLYSKLSFPLVHVIMALVAIPFALGLPAQRRARAVGIGVAIVIAVGYWVVHSVALAFAQADLLPPLLGGLDRQHRLRRHRHRPLPQRPHVERSSTASGGGAAAAIEREAGSPWSWRRASSRRFCSWP